MPNQKTLFFIAILYFSLEIGPTDLEFGSPYIVKQKWSEKNTVVLRTKSLTLIIINLTLICH